MATLTTSLSRPSLASHLYALWQITVKDWKQYWRYPLNALSTVIQPIVWLTPVYFMGMAFSVNGRAEGFAGYAGTTDYMSFIIIGNALVNFIMAVFWGMGYALKNDMDGGVLESNWLCPLPRPLLMIGRTFSNMITTALTSLGVVLLGWLFFGFHPTGNVLPALLSLLPMLIGLYGFGLAFASLVMIMREANTLVDIGSFLVQIFSGANFPVNSLPRWLLPVSLALPLTYGFDAVRGWLLGTQTLLPIHIEVYILLGSMFVLVGLGLITFRALERRVRMKGTLGQY